MSVTASPKPCSQRLWSQRGVGMVELLVAVVVLAIGFLATARMQVVSMHHSQSAYFESQAYFMMGEMVDRMRANVDGVRAGAYDGATTTASAVDPGCESQMCTPSEIAQQDIYEWSQYLYSDTNNVVPLLPSDSDVTAAGSVTRISDGVYTISVIWADEYDSDGGEGSLRVDMTMED